MNTQLGGCLSVCLSVHVPKVVKWISFWFVSGQYNPLFKAQNEIYQFYQKWCITQHG